MLLDTFLTLEVVEMFPSEGRLATEVGTSAAICLLDLMALFGVLL